MAIPNYSSFSRQSAYQAGQQPPFRDDRRGSRTFAKQFSGAHLELIDQLPDEDVKPYTRIGYCNVLLATLSGLSAFALADIFYGGNEIMSYFCTLVTVLLVLVLGRYSGRALINRTYADSAMAPGAGAAAPARATVASHSASPSADTSPYADTWTDKRRSAEWLPALTILFWVVVAGLVLAGTVLWPAQTEWRENVKASATVYRTLDSLKNGIARMPPFIPSRQAVGNPAPGPIYDPTLRLMYSRDRDTIPQIEDHESAIDSVFSSYQQFGALAEAGLKYLSPEDTTGLRQAIRRIRSVVEERYDYARTARTYGELRGAVRSLRLIRPGELEEITAHFNPARSQSASFGRKVEVLLGYGDATTLMIAMAAMLGVASLFRFIYTTARNSRDDFYHALLADKRRLRTEALLQQRKKIAEEYRLRSELKYMGETLSPDLHHAGAGDGANEYQAPGQSKSPPLTPASLLAAARRISERGDLDKGLEYINKAIELESDARAEEDGYRLNPDIYELKAKILKDRGLVQDAENADRLARSIRDENAFRDNKSKRIGLEKLVVEDVSIFDNFTWHFKPGVNILLGKNGYGKSHLLGLIIALLYDDKLKIKDWISGTKAGANASLQLAGEVPGRELEDQLAALVRTLREKQNALNGRIEAEAVASRGAGNEDEPDEDELDRRFAREIAEIEAESEKVTKLQKELGQFKPTIAADANTIRTWTGRIPLLAIPDSRFVNKSGDAVKASASEYSDMARYGAHEFLYGLPYAEVIENTLFRICLGYYESGKNFGDEPFGLIHRVIKSLSADKLVLRDGQLSYQDDSQFRFVSIESNDKNASFTIRVQPEDANIVLPIQKISQGTFSVVAVCCLIYNYLSAIAQQDAPVLQRRAMVIIDELDAHIHPSWQRKLIPILRKNFPNVQFLISAHSPLLVEGCKAGEVSVMRRTGEGKFRVETIGRSMIGFSIENIYSFIFEVENKDSDLLRYKELAPYQESFKRELDALRAKGERQELTPQEDHRADELQDILTHIDVSRSAVDKMQADKQKEVMTVSNLLKQASESFPIPPNP